MAKETERCPIDYINADESERLTAADTERILVSTIHGPTKRGTPFVGALSSPKVAAAAINMDQCGN